MQLFAQAELTWVQPLVQLVTAGGFGALVWYMMVKHIPAIESRHQKERAEWLAYIKDRDDSFETLTREHFTAISDIRSDIKDLGGKIDLRK